jgi:hypothetical protein
MSYGLTIFRSIPSRGLAELSGPDLVEGQGERPASFQHPVAAGPEHAGDSG